ncbi:MAG: 16S rRNA (cytosine(967)-C(5))-methyltransferase RsmB, partial [Clostridia bacterium]|nr:16S rRNA (cytosine(967)-C(5))-methyltransferase RsmB [Clostridia bacterium]
MDRDRRAAFLILKDIEEEQSWSNLAVGRQFSKENPTSPAFVREIVYGVLRNQNLLDFNINRYLAKPKLKNNEKILLRMGFYQLAFMDVKPYAAISETVNLAKSIMKGREGFINAVLRSFEAENCPIKYSKSKDVIKQYSVNYSASQSIVKLIINAYGEEQSEAILKVLCTPAPLSIRVNTLKISVEEFLKISP